MRLTFPAIFLLALLFSANTAAQSPFRTTLPETAKGDRLYSREQYKDALKEYSRLPMSVEVRKRLGATYIKLWDMSAAIRTLRDAAKSAPRDPELKGILAEALSWNKDFGEAAALFEEALANGDVSVDVRLGYARTLAWMKDFDAAIEQYRLAAKQEPSKLNAHMGLGQMLSWKKQFDQSIASYRRVLGLTNVPEYKGVALARIGQVQVWKGDLDEARSSWSEATRHDPKNVDALFGLGELDEWAGNYKQAKKRYERILQVQPGHKSAKAKLLQLMWVK